MLKKRLALVSPTLVADAFMYEEGPDLEPDEAAESAAFKTVALAALPGGGVRNGAIVAVSDQAQAFEAQLVVSHRVGRGDFLTRPLHYPVHGAPHQDHHGPLRKPCSLAGYSVVV